MTVEIGWKSKPGPHRGVPDEDAREDQARDLGEHTHATLERLGKRGRHDDG